MNRGTTPVVSVVTPAYNAADTILRASKSLQEQTFTDWEYIVVDDGSTDGTAGLLESVANPARLDLLRIPNQGIGAALNSGIARTRGQYVALLDADDEYLPEHLKLHVEEMDADPTIDLLWGGIELVSSNDDQGMVPDVVRGYGYIHAGECVVQGTLFVRRRVFADVLFTEDRSIWYPDFDFYRRVEAAGFRCRRFFQPTYRYHRESGVSIVDRVKETWRTE